MSSPLEAVLLLADAAAAQPDGKVSMLGAGWTATGSPTGPSAVVALIEVPWDRTNERISLSLELVDADGAAVQFPAPGMATQGIRMLGELEAGRPAGVAPGTPIAQPFAVNIGPLPLTPGRYSWRLTLGEQVFLRSFQVVAAPAGAPPA